MRDLILFAPHNLLKDPPFAKLDLLSCRNVLIYLRRTLLPELLALFHYALRPAGYLLLSPAESIEGHEYFRVLEKRFSLYQRQSGPRADLPWPLLPLSTVSHFGSPGTDLPPGSLATNWEVLYTTLLTQAAPPSVLVNPEFNILYFAPGVNRYLIQPAGVPTQAVLKLVRPELQADLAVALQLALQRGEPTESTFQPLTDEPTAMRVRVWPATKAEWAGFALVSFEERPLINSVPTVAALAATDQVAAAELTELKQRLQVTIEEYETAKEEMKVANEELLSMNEELRSSAEELETSKEELQSINEELLTLNQEHKHKIAELSQLTNDLQNLLSSTEIATLFLDRQFRIKRFTPRIGELFNILTADQGRPLTDLTHKLHQTDLVHDVTQVLQTLVPIEREVSNAQGAWYLMRVLPYRTVQDQIDGVVLTFIDISAQKQAATEREGLVTSLAAEQTKLLALTATLEKRVAERTVALEFKNEELARFAHTAAHDLKAPLRSIQHLAQWIGEETSRDLSAAGQGHLATLQARIKRLTRLVDDLLAYARVGRIDYNIEQIQLADLIQTVIELLVPPPGFTVTVAAALPPLLTARIPLETVLLNLISNALKHHQQPDQCRVQITAVAQGEWIEVAVTDNGPGIAATHLPHIFELLQTLKPRDVVEGSGLGLTIVKKIVENYGGRVTVESRLDQGATFRFTWPQIIPLTPKPPEGRAAPSAGMA